MSTVSREVAEADYDRVERRAFARLRLEDLMESTIQGDQRSITLQSMALVRKLSPRVHCFTDLLVISIPKGASESIEAVPDNMLVLHDGPIEAFGSYRMELQPAKPYCMIEYVSKRSAKKDFEESFEKYEKLKVPYYLIYHPDNEEISLYRYDKRKKRFVSVPPNDQGRYPLPEAELEAGILDGWMRYWFRGELVPLVAEREEQLAAERRRADAAEAEVERLRRLLGQK